MTTGVLEAILESTIDAIITIDRHGTILNVNEAALDIFGYAREELVGRNVNLLMPEPDHSQHDGYLERYLETKEAQIIGLGRRVLAKRKDGSVFPADLSVGEALLGKNKVFTGIVRDQSAQSELEAKLALSERLAAIGELAAGVAHEVNNPVNTMINCAQLIKDGDTDPLLCDYIISEGERVSQIVKNLLSFSRGGNEPPLPTRILAVVERTLGLVGMSFRKQGVHVITQSLEKVPQVFVKPQQLQQVLLNLLINAKDAFKYTDPEAQKHEAAKTIWLEAGLDVDGGENEWVVLTVRDNGPGIEPKVLGRIFDTFFTTKKSRGGTGLGLSISRGIIESFGGTLEAGSIYGEGATFTVRLPKAKT